LVSPGRRETSGFRFGITQLHHAAFIASTPEHVVNSAPENPWARILGLIEPLKPIPILEN
jgi:hypothetical protein